MSARLRRTAIALVGAGALAFTGLVGLAGPASADQIVTHKTGAVITALPAKAVLVGNQPVAELVTVKVALNGLACATDFTSRVVGQKNAVTVAVAPDCTEAGFAKWTVTANPITHKRNAVVKFIATNPTDQSRTVGTLVVKVNPGAKPAKPAKPANSNGPGNS